jgi:hypothetical protein
MWRKIFKLFGARVCATEDHDGEVRYRFVRSSPFGKKVCRPIGISGWVTLNEDGTCSGKSYVKRWKEV